VSGYRLPYSWDDFFKVGTVVCNALKQPARDAEILAISRDEFDDVTIVIKDLKTGFVTYGVKPTDFYFNVNYYKDW
jgi:hypothetical protein